MSVISWLVGAVARQTRRGRFYILSDGVERHPGEGVGVAIDFRLASDCLPILTTRTAAVVETDPVPFVASIIKGSMHFEVRMDILTLENTRVINEVCILFYRIGFGEGFDATFL